MTDEILNNLKSNDEFHKFIINNSNAETTKLRLKKFRDLNFDVNFAILQIDCKKRIKKKLPEIYSYQNFFFPNTLSTEQCTAEEIAKFHASLLGNNESILDMTAGLCIDSYYISKSVKEVTALEINPDVAIVSSHNMSEFTNNVTVLNCDCIDFVKNNTKQYSSIFIDPARRGENNKRLFSLSDCTPNILDLIPYLTKISKNLYIKASTMLDITQSIKELHYNVTDTWVIGINNECKEVLFKVALNNTSPVISRIHTINFENTTIQKLSLSSNDKSTLSKYYCELKDAIYLYEPNSCIMKAGIFASLEDKFCLTAISHNSHLFISQHFTDDFPGRKFKILELIPFKNTEIKNIKKIHPQINVSVRNFKLTAEELKKKLKVQDGGDKYLFGTTDKNNNALLLICEKV